MKEPTYNTIPMSEIRDEPRKLAVAWHENATNWIGDKHKLASDIQNYANWYALQVAEAVLSDAEDKIAEYIDTPIESDDELFQQGIKRGLLEIKKVNITDFIK